MGEHRTPYVVPWWCCCMRFDFEAYHRRRFERRGHAPRMAIALALMVARYGGFR